MQSTVETWKPVVGFEGFYQVSNLGRVESLGRWRKNSRGDGSNYLKPRILSTKPGAAGYNQTTLVDAQGLRHQRLVHNLVAEAFLGPVNGQVVRHLDGSPTNNALANLAYGTASENAYDAVEHGTHFHAHVTHCPHGHPYDSRNTYRSPSGDRRCRECKRILDRRRRAAKATREVA